MKPYYEDGAVTIYHGDAIEVMNGMTAGSVAASVTSPPYNTLGSRIPAKGTGMHTDSGWLAAVRETGYADDMDEKAYAAWQSDVAAVLGRVVRPGGSLFYNHKLRYRNMAVVHPLEIVRTFPGWSLRQEIVWDRPGAVAFNARMFAPSDERIYWLVRNGADFHWNQEAASFLTVWKMRPPDDVDGHPCPFPIGLPNRCIAATTIPGDIVIDPFMGAGTTLRAAKDMGRRSIGIDLEERYCEIAAIRCQQEVLGLSA